MNSKERSNSDQVFKRPLGWENYLCLIFKLSDMIKDSGFEFDCICGIPRGGLIPATILSHRLNIPLSTKFDNLFLDGRYRLMVDDICDTGDTLKYYVDSDWYKTATIFKHKDSKVIPDFFVEENSDWIIFPYENRSE